MPLRLRVRSSAFACSFLSVNVVPHVRRMVMPVRTRTVCASHAVWAAARAGHAGLFRTPIAAAAARAQASDGGAVAVAQGTLVFDGAAISGTSAVRSGRAAGCGPRRTGWCAQSYRGGAVYMYSGTVTFQGGSSITGSTAVRLAQTHARERIHGRTQADKFMREHAIKHSHCHARAGARAHTH
jgi:hypothetical protein